MLKKFRKTFFVKANETFVPCCFHFIYKAYLYEIKTHQNFNLWHFTTNENFLIYGIQHLPFYTATIILQYTVV